MRLALYARANPKKHAAIMLITSPINVSMFGEIRVRANPLTIFCSSQPLPLPNALVQVKKLVLWGENPVLAATLITHAAGSGANLPQRREWSAASESLAPACRSA